MKRHKHLRTAILLLFAMFGSRATAPLLGATSLHKARLAASLSLHPCKLPDIEAEARCGGYEVYEDRKAKTGRKITLNLIVLPALQSSPAPDAVFWLHGGPGAPATQTVGAIKGGFLEGLHRDHDLVFVDQRGTGNSNPLMCDIGDDPSNLPRFFGSLFPRDLVRDCREKLKKRADLRLYTTSIAMDDLEEVRAALGYREIDIVAASYGTIAAQAYMRQHPTSVRAVFLLGVATPGVKQPLLFAKAAQHAMDLLLEDCAADETCRAAFPDLRKEFAAVLARFKNGPVEAELLNPSNKHKESVQLSRDNFVERIRLLLYTTTFARFVPLVIHRAYENDFLPFETISVRYNPGALLARGMYMTITCSEGVPFITQAEMKLEAAGTFVGEGRTQSHMQACQEWPSGNAARAFINPVKSRLPVLMISGELDGSTPPWFARDAVKTLPNARQVGIRYYGHQLDSPCVWHILDQFIAKGSATELDLGCTGEIRRPPFATSIPQQMALQ